MASPVVHAQVMVELPTADYDLAASLPASLLAQYNTWVPTVQKDGKFWVRVSAQVSDGGCLSCLFRLCGLSI